MRIALIVLIVVTLVRPFAETIGGVTVVSANVLWALSIAWVALAIAEWFFQKRPRVMSSEEHARYFVHQSKKPAHLVWPGHELPKPSFPQYRGELLITAAAIAGTIWLLTAYRSHLGGIGTPGDRVLADPIVGFLIALVWVLVLMWLFTAARRLLRSTLIPKREDYASWNSHPLARWYREKRVSFLAVATVVSILMLGIGGVAVSAPAWAEDATVVKIVDGDTVDVAIGDRIERVRLLNVDTPELNGDEPDDCLAKEAREALVALLPVGINVTLSYDDVKVDRYGRTLAAISTADDVFVNAELAARGLGAAAFYGDNDRFLSEVEKGVRQAQAGKHGFYDPSVTCSPASVMNPVEAQLAAATVPLPADSAGISGVVANVAATVVAVETAEAALAAMKWLTPDVRLYFVDALADVRTKSSILDARAQTAFTKARAAEEAAAEKVAAEKAAAAKAAAKKAAAEKAAAEKAAAEQAAADAAAEADRRAAEEAAAAEDSYSGGDSSSGNESSGGGGSGDGGGSTYTGCRNYNGYGMIDTQGRHFEPIPC